MDDETSWDAVRAWAVVQARTAGRSGTVPIGSSAPERPYQGSESTVTHPAVEAELTDCTPVELAALTGQAGRANQVYAVVTTALPGGRLLVATGGADQRARVWDGGSGALLHELSAHEGKVYAVAWVAASDDRLWLATGCTGEAVQIWDCRSGRLLATLPGHTGGVRSIAGTTTADGRVLIAAGSFDGTVRLWNGGTGELLHTLAAHDDTVLCLDIAALPGGDMVLASGGWDDSVRIWNAGSGTLLRTLTGHEGSVMSVAWAPLRSSADPALATVDNEGVIRVWEALAGTLAWATTVDYDSARSAAWTELPDGRGVLATGNDDGTLSIRDHAGTVLCDPVRVLPGDRDTVHLSPAALDDGRITITTGGYNLIGDRVTGPTPVRVFDLTVTGSAPAALLPRDGTPRPAPGLTTRAGTDGVLNLGAAGVWLPLGLVEDLIDLTGPADEVGEVHDERLLTLAEHPGVRHLRTLGWPPRARCALAALLAASLDQTDRLVPPPAGPRSLHRALSRAVATAPIAPTPPDYPVDWITAAADRVDERTVSLLAVLGADAAATEPALAPRLVHLRDAMPVLPAESRLLLGSAEGPELTAPGAFRLSENACDPHSADTARHGPPARLLLTQHALDPAVFAHRYAQQLLLYRRHDASVAPSPVPVTLVLDTTPATFGPVERLLRLVAHLVTTTLWRRGLHPALVTLDRPDQCEVLDRTLMLPALWTTRTLDPPDLATAMATALSAPNPTVLLSQHHLPADLKLSATPEAQIVTTHLPGRPPKRLTVSPWHHHLPPDPGARALQDTVHAILTTSAEAAQAGSRR